MMQPFDIALPEEDNNSQAVEDEVFVFPTSFAQQRLWFLDQLEPDSPIYNVPAAVHLKGPVNAALQQQGVNEIVRRHEVLRTSFSSVDGQPMQIIAPALRLSLPLADLCALPEQDRRAEARRIALAEARRPFDLDRGPLLRVSLLRLGREECLLLITMHHIVSDGWSMGVFVREFITLYQAFSTGAPSPLQDLDIQYADFTHWQRQWLQGDVMDAQLDYWKQQLAGAPPALDLPADRPRPAVQSFRGSSQSFHLDAALTGQLKLLGQRQGATLFMTLLAAFVGLLSRYSGHEDIVVGSAIANRNRSQIEPLIGFFVNTLALRADLSGNPSFSELLNRIRAVTLDAYAHQDLPFERLVDELKIERNPNRNPLVQVMFALQNAPMPAVELPGLEVNRWELDFKTVRFDLECHLWEVPQGLTGYFIYSTDLFDATTIQRMMAHYAALLAGIAANPERRLSALPLLTDDQRLHLIEGWQNGGQEFSQAQTIYQMFEAQAEQRPEAVAVVFEDQQLTYEEVNRRANQLAHYLRSLGVGPEVLVGLCLERSPDLVIGLLGILKAGGAYVPLDQNYPHQRLLRMLQDTGMPVLLTQETLAVKFWDQPTRLVCLDAEQAVISQQSGTNPVSGATFDNLAYIIYTSGSTGKPKGVPVSHSNLTRLFAATASWFCFDERDAWTLFHSTAFDFSVWELFGALLFGGRLVIIPHWMSRSPQRFYERLSQQQVTVLNQTPSAFGQLIRLQEEPGGRDGLPLRLVILGGEALDFQSLRAWFERYGDRSPQLVNMYGITETTVHVTAYWLTPDDLQSTGSIIGSPIPDLQVYVLDHHHQPAPLGVPGEMFVGGAGLARGYLNRPRLTAERFLPNPFTLEPGARLYRTGDLGRSRSNKTIEYLGRTDHQVKIRGFRIEPGEIEATLRQHPAVRESVVVHREDGPDNKRLVAYVVPHQGSAVHDDRGASHADTSLFELPNGMPIRYLNSSETAFVYHEVFQEQTYLKGGISLRGGDCIFDVGANIGLFTLFAGALCRDATIYAFEPIPPVFEILRFNVSLYDINVKLFDCGLSAEPGWEVFTYYPNVSIISGRYADPDQEKKTITSFLLAQQRAEAEDDAVSSDEIEDLLRARLTSEQVSCHLKTLSEVIRENGVERIDLLKIDVEKSELDVLAGIREDDWPLIEQVVVEVQDDQGRLEAVTALLRKQGFELTIAQDVLLRDSDVYNVYAVHPSRGQQHSDETNGRSALTIPSATPTLKPHPGSLGARGSNQQAEHLSSWQTVYDEIYGQAPPSRDPTFNIIGWNSSYTGLPIPDEEMRQWVEQTTARILSLQPNAVLEIGCGTGLLLSRIAPHCTLYWGTDFSNVALQCARQLKNSLTGLRHVTLLNRQAHDFAGIDGQMFDTIILNSVVQYFPTIDYLVNVLEKAVSRLKPGGRIFIGDVRSLPLLEAFHASVYFHQAPDTMSREQLYRQVQSALSKEEELVIDPAFFFALRRHFPEISQVQVQPKRGRAQNELTRFRYDVTLHLGLETPGSVSPQWHQWQSEEVSLPQVRRVLRESKPECLGITDVPNARLLRELKLLHLLSDGSLETVKQLREALQADAGGGGVDPEQWWDVSRDLPYSIYIPWSENGFYDVLFHRRSSSHLNAPSAAIVESTAAKPWSQYANDPVQGQLARKLTPQLRNFLKKTLPEYMMPAAFVVLDSLPLTPSGKPDHRALPEPDTHRPEMKEPFVVPKNEAQRVIAKIWQERLQLDQVGVNDNFFDLGGHSLLLIQVNGDLQKAFNRNIKIVDLFRYPTIRLLASFLSLEASDGTPHERARDRACKQRAGFQRMQQGKPRRKIR